MKHKIMGTAKAVSGAQYHKDAITGRFRDARGRFVSAKVAQGSK